MGRMYSSKKPLTVISKKPPTRIQKIARDVARLKKKNKKIEFKYQDTAINISTGGAGYASVISSIQNITQGITVNDYIGNQYCVKSLQVDLTVKCATVTPNYLFYRIALVRYKSANGNTPSYGPSGGSDGIYQADNVYSPRNMNNRNDFVILKEWNLTIDASRQEMYRLSYYKKLDNMVTIDALTGLIEENAYYIVVSTTGPSGGNTLDIVGNARIRFTDE